MKINVGVRSLAAMLAAASLVSPVFGNEGQVPKGVPRLDHVFVILMENHGYSQIIGNPNAPFTNQYANSVNSGRNYFAVAHPSSDQLSGDRRRIEFRSAERQFSGLAQCKLPDQPCVWHAVVWITGNSGISAQSAGRGRTQRHRRWIFRMKPRDLREISTSTASWRFPRQQMFLARRSAINWWNGARAGRATRRICRRQARTGLTTATDFSPTARTFPQ